MQKPKIYNKNGIRQLLKNMCDYCEKHKIVTVDEFKKELDNLLAFAENN